MDDQSNPNGDESLATTPVIDYANDEIDEGDQNESMEDQSDPKVLDRTNTLVLERTESAEEKKEVEWDRYKSDWNFQTNFLEFQDRGEDYIPHVMVNESRTEITGNPPPCCLIRSENKCLESQDRCKYDLQRGCIDLEEEGKNPERVIPETLLNLYYILNNILSVYTNDTDKKQLIRNFLSFEQSRYSENIFLNQFFHWCNNLFNLIQKQTNPEPETCPSRQFGRIKITILYKYTRDRRNHYVIESEDVKNKLGRFVLYESLSDFGILKLKIKDYMKLNDYVTSTLINLEVQTWIRQLDKNGEIDETKRDQYNEEAKRMKKIEDTLIANPYVIYYFDTRTICNSSPGLNILTNWIRCLNINCGEFTTPSKSFEPYPLYFDSYLLARFINDHQLDVELGSIPTNVGLDVDYIKIFRIIAAYYKKNFIAVSPKTIEFSRTLLFERPSQCDWASDTWKEQPNILFTITTYQLKVKELETGNLFKYFYMEYKVNGFNWINPEELYTYPLCIVPDNSSMLPFGVYDCYIPGGLYFCKPIEYAKQCPFQTSNVLFDECKRRELGEAGQYYFIGDLLSGWIIPPMQQGQQQQQQQQPQHQFPQQQRQPTSYGKAKNKTCLPSRKKPY